jgi:general secretion pathway protein J
MHPSMTPSMRRGAVRAFTLLEVLVAVGIITLIGTLIYGAFHGMARSRDNIQHAADRYQQGRSALTHMSQELGSAFISGHVPPDQNLVVRQTVFIGADRGNGDRVDFTAFAHRQLRRDGHESDQAEISYFLSNNPDGGLDLVRRVDKHIDTEPQQGGIVEVLADHVESFDIRYMDPVTNEWQDTWDSTQPSGQLGRLPTQVWITLVLAGGPGGQPVKFETKARVFMQDPLMWAVQ